MSIADALLVWAGYKCPKCGKSNVEVVKGTPLEGEHFRCEDCGARWR